MKKLITAALLMALFSVSYGQERVICSPPSSILHGPDIVARGSCPPGYRQVGEAGGTSSGGIAEALKPLYDATSELVRFDLSRDPIKADSITLDILPDNVRWGEPGMLLTAGGNTSGDGWSVIEIDADTLGADRVGGMSSGAILQGASSALQIDNTIWVGTYSGDRIGYFEKE